MELAKDTRERIFAAANSLYEQAGRAGNFPTVDAVRKLAKVNMNDASVGMKEWRRTQTAQAAPVAVQVPEAIQQASGIALAALWHEAQELANESLRAAQAGWDAERTEAETLNKQMADAYESLVVDLEASQAAASRFQSEAEASSASNALLTARLDEAGVALTAAAAATATADARTVEIERRATELRVELDHAHQEAAQAREVLAGVHRAHTSEVEALRVDLAALQAKADQAALTAAGQIDALRQAHSAEVEAMKAKADQAASASSAQLDTLRNELATVRARAEAAQESHQQQRTQAASEVKRLAEQLEAAKAGRDQAEKAAASAREESAALRGQMDALKDQNSQLLQTLKADAEKRGSNNKK
jgi:chromosome segregation ATPase